MSRWQPNAHGRLEQAALELYVERGFDRTTVAEIAERAGLTERTFYRHYADKREVLFGDGTTLPALLAKAVEEAPESAKPIDAVAAALDSWGVQLQKNRKGTMRRHDIISAHPELWERYLVKRSKLAAAMAEGLRGRGVDEPAATLAAESGMAAFEVAHARWLGAPDSAGLTRYLREAFRELKAVIAGD
ncbi:TetR family transcriptional regulator [Amycolatopsis acidicola]|uniref:TetR family transcriptional regulator n=1 Tax=Amycolatopsis acidicola TaxID=2596893 RepID=A0A5N0UVU9_9PSEU|nr:TetR family transcriptional regulator [Amycolatopsis acidicola]KAA9156182.1 TetR family transcriptional regulator [Amycolatopsis acidicola]